MLGLFRPWLSEISEILESRRPALETLEIPRDGGWAGGAQLCLSNAFRQVDELEAQAQAPPSMKDHVN